MQAVQTQDHLRWGLYFGLERKRGRRENPLRLTVPQISYIKLLFASILTSSSTHTSSTTVCCMLFRAGNGSVEKYNMLRVSRRHSLLALQISTSFASRHRNLLAGKANLRVSLILARNFGPNLELKQDEVKSRLSLARAHIYMYTQLLANSTKGAGDTLVSWSANLL